MICFNDCALFKAKVATPLAPPLAQEAAVPGAEFLRRASRQRDGDRLQLATAVLVVVLAPPLVEGDEPLEFARMLHERWMLASRAWWLRTDGGDARAP